MSWIALSFTAAVLWSAAILFDKFVVDKEISDFLIDVSMNGLGLYSVLFLGALTMGEIIFSAKHILGGFLVGSFYFSAIAVYYRGIQTEEVSRFVPVFSTSAIFVAVLSFLFLGESFSALKYLGIVLTVAGAFLISLENPRESLKQFRSGKGLLLGLLVALLFSFRDVSFKYFSSGLEFWNLLFWVSVTGLTLSALTLGSRWSKASKCRGLRHLGATGLIAGTAYLSFSRAVSIGPVSLSSAIIRSQPLFVFLGSTIITQIHPEIISEELDRSVILQKLSAILVAIIGLLIITLV